MAVPHRPLVLALAGLLLAVPACTTTTTQTKRHSVLTPEEAAESDRQRKKKAEGEKTAPPAPAKEETAGEREERLRAELLKDDQNPKWHFMLGAAYEEDGKLELAEMRYRSGADLIPKDPLTPGDHYTGPHLCLGRVLAKLSKRPEALAELQRAVAVKQPDNEGYYLNPDYREAYYLIGAIKFQQGDRAGAEDAFRAFLKYGGERSRVVEFIPELMAD